MLRTHSPSGIALEAARGRHRSGMHLGYAKAREEKYSRSENRGLVCIHVSFPWGQSRGRLSQLTLTQKFAKSSEKWRPVLVSEA